MKLSDRIEEVIKNLDDTIKGSQRGDWTRGKIERWIAESVRKLAEISDCVDENLEDKRPWEQVERLEDALDAVGAANEKLRKKHAEIMAIIGKENC